MPFEVSDLRANLQFGGARPTLFEVQMTLPGNISPNASRLLTFTCQAAEIPPSTIGTINIPYFGRMIPYPGDRVFQPWQITVINDEDFSVRDAFENWHNTINARQQNIRLTSTDVPDAVMTTALVRQFSRNDNTNPIRVYTFNNVWPGQISGIELNWGAQDQIEQFQVTLNYSWWDVTGPTVVDNKS